ncbi:MAG: type VII toxin-antitoxin system HepT family RNase toxin [Actinomycetota bacterium]
MVDAERLRRILQRVSEDISVLREYAARDVAALHSNAAQLGHAKYLFVTAIEGCIDAAHHVCASEGWGPPETNADTMDVLAQHNVLDQDLANSMVAAVRFRNVLVHGYAKVDDDRVIETLKSIGDLEAFVASLAQLAG